MSKDKRFITIVWHAEDVRERPGGENLTTAECMQILERIKRQHDANIGITWDTIDDGIENFIAEEVA